MSAEMTMDMAVLDETELTQIDGGIWPGIVAAAMLAREVIKEIENNPQDYTWTMDWYYNR